MLNGIITAAYHPSRVVSIMGRPDAAVEADDLETAAWLADVVADPLSAELSPILDMYTFARSLRAALRSALSSLDTTSRGADACLPLVVASLDVASRPVGPGKRGTIALANGAIMISVPSFADPISNAASALGSASPPLGTLPSSLCPLPFAPFGGGLAACPQLFFLIEFLLVERVHL